MVCNLPSHQLLTTLRSYNRFHNQRVCVFVRFAHLSADLNARCELLGTKRIGKSTKHPCHQCDIAGHEAMVEQLLYLGQRPATTRTHAEFVEIANKQPREMTQPSKQQLDRAKTTGIKYSSPLISLFGCDVST